jgi:P27 family predicted phage terminase small subunit
MTESVSRPGSRPPAGLDKHGKSLWRKVTGEWGLRPDELELLYAACRTRDEIARMEDALGKSSVTVRGSQGQVRPHPLIGEVRAHRLAFRQLLGQLGIDEAESDDAAADDARSRSTAGRKLALVRHHGG